MNEEEFSHMDNRKGAANEKRAWFDSQLKKGKEVGLREVQCWEFMKCGREKDDSCPAIATGRGRACWLVAGTLCGGKVQGSNAQKVATCKECDFYVKVKKGEI